MNRTYLHSKQSKQELFKDILFAHKVYRASFLLHRLDTSLILILFLTLTLILTLITTTTTTPAPPHTTPAHIGQDWASPPRTKEITYPPPLSPILFMSLEDKRANLFRRILFMSYDFTPEIIYSNNPHAIPIQSPKIRIIRCILYYSPWTWLTMFELLIILYSKGIWLHRKDFCLNLKV